MQPQLSDVPLFEEDVRKSSSEDEHDEENPLKHDKPTVLIVRQPDLSLGLAASKGYQSMIIESPRQLDPLNGTETPIDLEEFITRHMRIFLILSLYLILVETATLILFYKSIQSYVYRVSISQFQNASISYQALESLCVVFSIFRAIFVVATFVMSMLGVHTWNPTHFNTLFQVAFVNFVAEGLMITVGQFYIMTFLPRIISIMYAKFLRVALVRYELTF